MKKSTIAKRLAAILAAASFMLAPSFTRAQSISYPGTLVQQNNTLGALNDKSLVTTNFGFLSCTINVGSGLTGTVTFKVASDQAGSNLAAYAFTPQGGGTAVSTTTTSGVYQATFSGPVTGCEAIVTAYSSGSAAVNVSGSVNPGSGSVVVTSLPTAGVNVLNTPGVNVVNFPAAGPTDTNGIPLVHPTALPTQSVVLVNVPGVLMKNNALSCTVDITAPGTSGTTCGLNVQGMTGGVPLPVTTPAPGPTTASGITEKAECDPTTAQRCATVTSLGQLSSTPSFASGDAFFEVTAWGGSLASHIALLTASYTMDNDGSGTYRSPMMDGNSSAVQRMNTGATTEVELTAAAGVCAQITTTPTRLVNVYYVSESAQTGTLKLYNNATCTGSVIYDSSLHGVLTTPENVNFWASSKLYYQWTTTGEVGNVYAGYN